MSIFKDLFKSKLCFQEIDPLDDGLREMIERERNSPYAIELYEDEVSTSGFWRAVEDDLHTK